VTETLVSTPTQCSNKDIASQRCEDETIACSSLFFGYPLLNFS
jgi:hypothetical protein